MFLIKFRSWLLASLFVSPFAFGANDTVSQFITQELTSSHVEISDLNILLSLYRVLDAYQWSAEISEKQMDGISGFRQVQVHARRGSPVFSFTMGPQGHGIHFQRTHPTKYEFSSFLVQGSAEDTAEFLANLLFTVSRISNSRFVGHFSRQVGYLIAVISYVLEHGQLASLDFGSLLNTNPQADLDAFDLFGILNAGPQKIEFRPNLAGRPEEMGQMLGFHLRFDLGGIEFYKAQFVSKQIESTCYAESTASFQTEQFVTPWTSFEKPAVVVASREPDIFDMADRLLKREKPQNPQEEIFMQLLEILSSMANLPTNPVKQIMFTRPIDSESAQRNSGLLQQQLREERISDSGSQAPHCADL